MTMNNTKVEELRALLLDFEEDEVLEALVANNVVNGTTGSLTDYWLALVNPNLAAQRSLREEEDVVLSALSKLLKRRIK